jgi:hypothetical protein
MWLTRLTFSNELLVGILIDYVVSTIFFNRYILYFTGFMTNVPSFCFAEWCVVLPSLGFKTKRRGGQLPQPGGETAVAECSLISVTTVRAWPLTADPKRPGSPETSWNHH